MTIVYAVICRASDATILVENTSSELKGNAAQVTLALMQHLRDHPELVEDGDHKTLKHRNDEEENDFFDHFVHAACTATHLDDDDPDEHFFHLLLKDDVFYCCLGDDPASRDQVVYVYSFNSISLRYISPLSAFRTHPFRALPSFFVYLPRSTIC
jgi:hypothetical protein